MAGFTEYALAKRDPSGRLLDDTNDGEHKRCLVNDDAVDFVEDLGWEGDGDFCMIAVRGVGKILVCASFREVVDQNMGLKDDGAARDD